MANEVLTLHAWERFIIGVFGASLVTAAPMLNYIYAPPLEQARDISTEASGGAFVTLLIAWATSIYLTTRMKDDNLLRCFFTSVGLPAILVAAAQLSQVPN